MSAQVPDYLMKYKRPPEEILDGRVLPPAFPKGGKRPNRTREVSKYMIRKYLTPESLEYAIDLYFESLFNEEGKQIRPATVPGLAVALGFSSTESLFQYARNEEFEHVMGRALLLIETDLNELLLQGGAATPGAKFNLMAKFGWKEKVEQTSDISGGSLAELVKALQGKVLRPKLNIQPDEVIEDAEYETETEEVCERGTQLPTSDEYAEDAEMQDDIEDLL